MTLAIIREIILAEKQQRHPREKREGPDIVYMSVIKYFKEFSYFKRLFLDHLPEKQPGHRRQHQGKSIANEQKCLLNTNFIGEHADQWACADEADTENK
jgi:hypothetical protein